MTLGHRTASVRRIDAETGRVSSSQIYDSFGSGKFGTAGRNWPPAVERMRVVPIHPVSGASTLGYLVRDVATSCTRIATHYPLLFSFVAHSAARALPRCSSRSWLVAAGMEFLVTHRGRAPTRATARGPRQETSPRLAEVRAAALQAGQERRPRMLRVRALSEAHPPVAVGQALTAARVATKELAGLRVEARVARA